MFLVFFSYFFISCQRKSSRKPDTWILRKPRNIEKKAFRILQRDMNSSLLGRKLREVSTNVTRCEGNTFFKANDMVAAKQDTVTVISQRYKQILDSWNDLTKTWNMLPKSAKQVILAKGVWWSHPKKSNVLCWQGCSASGEVALHSSFIKCCFLSQLDCRTCWWWNTKPTTKLSHRLIRAVAWVYVLEFAFPRDQCRYTDASKIWSNHHILILGFLMFFVSPHCCCDTAPRDARLYSNRAAALTKALFVLNRNTWTGKCLATFGMTI